MVTNLCPNNGNAQWCPQPGSTNQYGYSYHFDITAQNEVFGDNPVVNFELVACPGQATSDWETCQCYGKTATDVTPSGLSSGGGGGGGGSSSSSITTTSSRTTTSTMTTTTSSSGGSGGTQSHYGQCGGSSWTGPTTCAAPYTCQVANPYYSQCL
jgi:endoglucanase